MAKKSPKLKSSGRVSITDRTLEDFFMNEYFDYAKYSISNRALPSIIDGLKPGARKIMHAAFSVLKGGKEQKFFDVVGAAYSKSQYHHGDASLVSTIMTLATDYKDNLAPLEIIGSGGDLRNHSSAAPRYLEVKLSPWAKLLEKDSHILEYNFDGDQQIEPTHYLPIIPLVLAARSVGMSVGYKFNSQVSYNPAELVEQCINVLNTGKLSGKLRPHIMGYKGSFEQVGDRIKASGNFVINRDHIIVTELPPNETFSSFENNLIKLLETGKITNWEDLSEDGNMKYRIDVNATKLEAQVNKNVHFKLYNLAEFLTRPTYTLLDENGKIAIFKSAEEVLKYFVDFRLKTYDTLKAVNIDNLNKRITDISNVLKFLDLYFDEKIVLGKDVSFQNAKDQITKYNLPISVLDIKFSKMTKEEYDKLMNEKSELTKELKLITETPTKTLYLRELKELHLKMINHFPVQEFSIRDISQVA